MDAITEVELPPDWRKLLTPDREAKKAARAETLARLKQALAAAEAKLRLVFENGGRASTLMPARAARESSASKTRATSDASLCRANTSSRYARTFDLSVNVFGAEIS